MKNYKDTNNKLHVIDEGFENLLPSNCIQITQAEAEALIAPTPAEIAAQLASQVEADAIKALRVETKANAAFDALKSADFATINTFINLHFATTDVQGRAMLKVMAAAAGAYLRENKG
jgi:hypothetical protein